MENKTRYQPITLPSDCLQVLKGFGSLPDKPLGRADVIRRSLHAVEHRIEKAGGRWKSTDLYKLIRPNYRWLYTLHNTNYYSDGEIDGLISRLLTVPDAPKRQPLTVVAIRLYSWIADWSMVSKLELDYDIPVPEDWYMTVARYHWIDQTSV